MKLLLIEDDRQLAAALGRGLTAEGFTVEHAADGLEGRWRATEFDYDLIVLDLMLPGRNGYQVCADLRAAGDWTPILMLTAKSGEYDEAEGLDTGADDFLTKPFSFAVLVARIRALLRRAATREPTPHEVADLVLEPTRRRATYAGAEVALTAREFDVLGFLVRHRDQVVSKDAVLGGVWDSAFDGDPNIVEVYVARLRRKLERAGGTVRIETLRGAGYRLTAGTGTG